MDTQLTQAQIVAHIERLQAVLAQITREQEERAAKEEARNAQ